MIVQLNYKNTIIIHNFNVCLRNVSLNQTIMKTGGYLYVDTDLGYLNNLNQPGVKRTQE